MKDDPFAALFPAEVCATLMPAGTADDFFEALLGDAEEGAYDLELKYASAERDTVHFDILLHERPGHCLSCSLTYGLPQVFSRHPVIDIDGLVKKIDAILADAADTADWRLGSTSQNSGSEHVIPLLINVQPR